MENKRIICLIGPSGSGKTKIGELIESEFGIPKVITYTTRKQRNHEVDGKDYNFVDNLTFDNLEKIEETVYSGNRYCTAKKNVIALLEQFPIIYSVVTLSGFNAYKRFFGDNVISFFIETDEEICVQRMLERGDKISDINDRVKHYFGTGEFKERDECDFIIDNNGTITEAVSQIASILSNL